MNWICSSWIFNLANNMSHGTVNSIKSVLVHYGKRVASHNNLDCVMFCEKVYERSGKNLFWSIKNLGEILDKLKARDFNATSLSTYDFSTLYKTLPHNWIKDKLIDLIERTFNREGSSDLACNGRDAFFTSGKPKKNMHGLVKMYVMRWPFCWTTFLFDLAPSWLDM